ncbi:MAG: hypothetical protein RLY93_16205 [Sumerlaeia bacterium]
MTRKGEKHRDDDKTPRHSDRGPIHPEMEERSPGGANPAKPPKSKADILKQKTNPKTGDYRGG